MRLTYENPKVFVQFHSLPCFRILYDFNKFIENKKIKVNSLGSIRLLLSIMVGEILAISQKKLLNTEIALL